jgi:hypothetical protein
VRAAWARDAAPAAAAFAASLALSVPVAVRRPLVNNDGVFYLLAADAFTRDGFAVAGSTYGWPFHPILIALAASLLGCSTETAARIVAALLLALTCSALVAVVRALGGGLRLQWLAAAVAIAHPWLNHARALVVRDAGVWAFGLLALAMLLRLEKEPRLATAAWCAASGVAAVLFRAEAIALMAAAAAAVALRLPATRRRRAVLTAALAAPLVAAAVLGAWWLSLHPAHGTFDVSWEPFRRSAGALAAAFPTPYGREYAPYLLAAGLLALPLVKAIKTAGLVHCGLAAAGVARGPAASAFQRAALGCTLAAAFAPLALQAARLLFLESRHTVFATLVACAWAPAGLEWLLKRGARVATALAVALAATVASSLPLRAGRGEPVLAAADWVRANARGGRLHTNSLQVAYYSGAAVDWPRVNHANVHGPWDGVALAAGDVWAVRVDRSDAESRARMDAAPGFRRAAEFVGDGGDAVRVLVCVARCVTPR